MHADLSCMQFALQPPSLWGIVAKYPKEDPGFRRRSCISPTDRISVSNCINYAEMNGSRPITSTFISSASGLGGSLYFRGPRRAGLDDKRTWFHAISPRNTIPAYCR